MSTHKITPLSERAALAADRVRVADLDAQILKLERSLNSLRDERNLLQDRLDAYTYPVLTLPNEIVSEIFVHFLPVYPKCPPPIGLLSPYLLCHICRKWRHIASATPALWRAISLPLRWPRNTEPRQTLLLHILKLLLKSSGSCLLSIRLDSDGMNDSACTLFARAITDHCARWEHLDLSIPWPLNFLPREELPLPFLRSLRLGFDGENFTTTTTFLAAPLLQKVSLVRYRDAHGPIFPWSQLTVLSVDFIKPNKTIHLLNQLVNVVHCRLNIDLDTEPILEPASWRDATLPYLETLIISAYRFIPGSRSLLDALTSPVLQRLQVTESLLNSAD
ncbi:hypothetical protein B0H13DRAFT_1727764, partial [Mycena leptocephala]